MTSFYQTTSTASSFNNSARSSTPLHFSVDHSPSFFHHALDSTNPTPKSLASSEKTDDLFHGHEEVATTTSNFIFEKFGCSPDGDSNSDEPFCYGLDLPHFIARCIHMGNIPYNYVWGAVLLLMRYHATFEKGWDKDAHGSLPLLGHSMFLCALYYSTQEYFDPTGRSTYCLDVSLWVEMTGFSMEESVLLQYFWNFFASLSGKVDVDCHLDGVPKPNPARSERKSRPRSAKEIAELPQPPYLRP